nr:unnamed protein product [Naegleria fowleri]
MLFFLLGAPGEKYITTGHSFRMGRFEPCRSNRVLGGEEEGKNRFSTGSSSGWYWNGNCTLGNHPPPPQQRDYHTQPFHHHDGSTHDDLAQTRLGSRGKRSTRYEYRKTVVRYALMLSLTLPMLLMLGSKYLLIHLTKDDVQVWNSIWKPVETIDELFHGREEKNLEYENDTSSKDPDQEEVVGTQKAIYDSESSMKTFLVDHNIYEFTSENIRNKILDIISESIEKVKQSQCDLFEIEEDMETVKRNIKIIAIDKRQTRSLLVKIREMIGSNEFKKEFKLFNTKGILFIHAPVMTNKGVVFIRTCVLVSNMKDMNMCPYRVDMCQLEVQHYQSTPKDKTPTRVAFKGFRDEEDDTSVLPISYEQLAALFEQYQVVKCAKIPTPNHVIEIVTNQKPVFTNAFGYEFSDSYETGNQLKLVRVQ